ncbi:MAG: hypothetical protein K6G40_00680 [Eubacterium sp.]|nr:hypothetical protein [Eubacterium sp.]
MNLKKNYGMNIGTSSVMLIFFVLCLVSFAALTLSSALADKTMTDKSEEKTTGYYEACSIAEERLCDIDKELSAAYESGMDKDEYFEEFGDTVNFTVAISDTRSLYVELEILYPENDGESFYEITTWQEKSGELEGGTTIID